SHAGLFRVMLQEGEAEEIDEGGLGRQGFLKVGWTRGRQLLSAGDCGQEWPEIALPLGDLFLQVLDVFVPLFLGSRVFGLRSKDEPGALAAGLRKLGQQLCDLRIRSSRASRLLPLLEDAGNRPL